MGDWGNLFVVFIQKHLLWRHLKKKKTNGSGAALMFGYVHRTVLPRRLEASLSLVKSNLR